MWFKHEIVQKWKNTFTFALNAAKNTHYPKKSFKWKFFSIEFQTKKSARAYVYLPPGVKVGGLKYDMVEILNCTETENEKKIPNNFYLKLSLE